MPDELTPVASDSGASNPAQKEFQGELNIGDSGDTPSDGSESPEAVPAAKDSTAEPASQGDVAAAPAEPVAAVPKFNFYGREWESEEAASQHFRSQDGRIRAQGQELRGANDLVRRWNDWYSGEQDAKEADALKAKEEKGEPYLDAIDWNSVNAMIEKGGPVAGIKAAILQLGDHLKSEAAKSSETVSGQIAEARKPAEDAAQIREADTYARGWFLNAASAVDGAGQPVFKEIYQGHPEFNEAITRETVSNWGKLIRAYPDFGMSRDGLDLAIAKAKQSVGAAVAGTGKARQAAQAVVRDTSGRFTAQSEATVGDEAEGGTGASAGNAAKGTPQSASEAEQRRAIREAGRPANKEAADFFGIA